MIRVSILLVFIILFPVSVLSSVQVFVAASLYGAMREVVLIYNNSNVKNSVHLVVGGTSTLARQIENGAPADIFISANKAWINYLKSDGKIKIEKVEPLLGNTLVVASRFKEFSDFKLSDLETTFFATGIVDAVPVGIYAKQALISTGSSSTIFSNIVQMDSVSGAIAMLETRNVDYAIIYKTDVINSNKLRIAHVFDETTHSKIEYSIASISDQPSKKAEDFLKFLKGNEAMAIFQKFGFKLID